MLISMVYSVSSGSIGAAATIHELHTDPHPLLRRLRAGEPVSWLPALDGWLVTRRDLALQVMRDSVTFTVDDPRFSTATLIGPSMLSLDGVEHTRHREPFARPFRPALTRDRFAAFVEREVDRLIAALYPIGHAELRGAFAGPLAVAVVAEALGLEHADSVTIRSWYDAFVVAISDITAGRDGDATQAYEQLRASVQAAVADRRPSSLLADVATREGGLDLAEIVSNAAVLMFGGIDTTEGMIVNCVRHLLGHPDQLALVRDDPDLLPNAIEESLRLEPAAAVIDRYATREVQLDGASIRRGELVRVSITGANRDPEVFPDPDRFEVRRGNAAEHLAFAHGPHFCFGAHLARLETRTALRGLLDRLPGLRLDPERPSAPEGLVFRKPQSVQVLWEPMP
jgi:cytochrome P450